MDTVIDMPDESKALDLASIRFQLMSVHFPELKKDETLTEKYRRLEDTITYHLIERVQFALNKVCRTARRVNSHLQIS